ncbi:hypothetical protein FJK98_25495 [Micromonospora sp. HM134]|uniref:hypothetical protein n=1 Tax=unclassified Micromonospora TaxID=2617518 RepID=UPI00119888C7|nr:MULTISPECIES: hypothetical protein [unclassified Micromonospora]QDY10096.1 hypothetical protein FJK98_25495 [Micromonospora sp. HM134]
MSSDRTRATTRRQLVRGGVAVGAGVVVGGVVVTPAEAAAGEPVRVGQPNDAGTAGTLLTGGSSDAPTLTLTHDGGRPPLVLAPTPEASIPAELPTGSLAVTDSGDLVIGGRDGTRRYVSTSRWANRTLAVAPVRILDTRAMDRYAANVVAGAGDVVAGRLGAGRALHVTVRAVPPALAGRATAAYVNVTVAGTVSGGFLTAYSSSIARPGTSSLNWWGPNQVLSNLVEVQLGSHQGTPLSFGVHVNAATSVIVDVCGLVLTVPEGS